MSGASKGSGPDQPTLPVPPARPALGQDKTQADFTTEVGLAHTIGATGDMQMSAQLPTTDAGISKGVFTPQPSGSGSLAMAMLPHQITDLAPGTMVGEYRVEGKLGEGGMGQVFASIHPVIGKRAAIKVIKLELCSNAEAVERFVQEARAVNQIGHANIVDVFAFGTLPDGRRYLVMEWLKGESLGARIKREKLSVEDVCEVLDPICRALEGAHEKRIIHRDLKPDNVFLCTVKGEKPVVKLLDFGIAKLVGNEDTRLERTRTGSMLGTPAYISPEQARGRGVDERTDIYALGAMAFEMFTGRPPFDADNAMDMISSHLHDAPPAPCTVSPGLPVALDTLLLGMLEKDPGKRPSLARVRETLAEVKRAPLAMRSTVQAEPPLVDRSAPLGSPNARTAPMAAPMPTEPIAGRGRNKLPAVAADGVQVTALVKRGASGTWIAVAVAVVVAVGAVAAFVATRGDGADAKVAPAAAPVAPPSAAIAVPPPAVVTSPPAAVVAPPPAVARTGTLSVAVNVPDATVEAGGQTVKAVGGHATISLPVGDVDLVVSAPGRKPFSKKITVAEGGTVSERVRLERGKAVPVAPRPPAGGKKDPAVKAGTGDKPPAKDPGKKPPGDDDTIW